MLPEISNYLKQKINYFSNEERIIFNGKEYPIQQGNFKSIPLSMQQATIAFIDGGQAEIISAGNFSCSFIRVVALIMKDNKNVKQIQKEFFLVTTATYQNSDIFYESKVFGDKIIDEQQLFISSNVPSIKVGKERAPIFKLATIARRFAELALSSQIEADYVLLDGTLEPSFRNEEKYLPIQQNICSLAKSSSLFTTSGNSPVVLLNKIHPGVWSYHLDHSTFFVKLHQQAKHVFRFEGDEQFLPFLVHNSSDAPFLGYPYGLVLADKLARVSNAEKNSLKMRFLLHNDNKDLLPYLSTSNAHDKLDSLG